MVKICEKNDVYNGYFAVGELVEFQKEPKWEVLNCLNMDILNLTISILYVSFYQI